MNCPFCEHRDPKLKVLHDEQIVIAGEGRMDDLKQKADVEVECANCHERFMLQFHLEPDGPMIDLS